MEPNTNTPRYPEGSYKVYTAKLTQVTTGAPTAVVLQNTIGAIVWTRSSQGNFNGTLTGAFPAGRTWVMMQIAPTTDGFPIFLEVAYAYRLNDNVIRVNTANSSAVNDGQLLNTPIEIRVYNVPNI